LPVALTTVGHRAVGDDNTDVVDYYCDEAGFDRSLLRGIDKAPPVWTARAVRYVNGRYERPVCDQVPVVGS
jgi:hypothetical protein